MLFAAGLGSRLKPLTDDLPKALVSVAGQTLLERSIHLLASQGVEEIVINIHFYGDRIVDYVKDYGHFGLDIRFSDESAELLETGGGLLKAADYFKGTEPFIVLNSDIITNINFSKMMASHIKSGALATLAMRKRPESSRQLLFDENGMLCGRTDRKKGEEQLMVDKPGLKSLAFSGIHILSPQWFDLVTQKGKFSIIESYLELCKDHKIIAYQHDSDYWFDVGSVEKLLDAEIFLKTFDYH